ncbi:hypothetical protein FA95DRAFT_789452 [Auriscalpium vulgare]|uniref:Uncharacterized protein n=1 Tax=Auriscalpium vulgare TaxID=40419 RepID=A0ACB8RAU8_9AGAM|nr:hypothetical protein FA95DRAFT_789452 [Auriscalpium vulgare]
MPPEMLATIFSCLKDIDKPWRIRTSHYDSCSSLGWLAATYVCQRWRQVALQQAVLWTDITLEPYGFGRGWASRALALARNCLLSIKASNVGIPWQRDFLVDNIWRTQSLCIDVDSAKSLPTLDIEAPLLHTLEMNLQSCYTFPDCFLGRGASALRHLRMRFDAAYGAHMPWSLPPFRHLISLDLDDTYAPPEDVLNGLSHLSTLERLRIRLGKNADVRRTLAPVALAKLAHLELWGRVLNATKFLRHILLPSHAIIRCHLHDYVLENLDVAALKSVYSHSDTVSEICSVITSLEIKASFSLHGSTEVAINLRKDTSALHEPALSIHFPSLYSTLSTLSTLVPMAISAFSSAHLKELIVGNTHEIFDGQAWADSVGRAPGLRSLTVAGSAAISFCAALRLTNASSARRTRARSKKSHAPPFLPELSILILSDMRLGIDDAFIGPELEDEGELLAYALPMRLAERAAAGYTLEELDVISCEVDEAWVTRTREALPGTRVKWDEGARERAKAENTAA